MHAKPAALGSAGLKGCGEGEPSVEPQKSRVESGERDGSWTPRALRPVSQGADRPSGEV